MSVCRLADELYPSVSTTNVQCMFADASWGPNVYCTIVTRCNCRCLSTRLKNQFTSEWHHSPRNDAPGYLGAPAAGCSAAGLTWRTPADTADSLQLLLQLATVLLLCNRELLPALTDVAVEPEETKHQTKTLSTFAACIMASYELLFSLLFHLTASSCVRMLVVESA